MPAKSPTPQPAGSSQPRTEDLLPCPFCGTAATIREHLQRRGSWFAVGCPSAECVIAPQSVDDSRTLAIQLWNTRAVGGAAGSLDVTPVAGCDCLLCKTLRLEFGS